MSIINILLTHPDADGFEQFSDASSDYKFARIDVPGPKPVVEGPAWIFIDWVLEEMAGIELCRRLRADPQTANAHITMVLPDNVGDARKRALDAGADDYMTGPIDRRIVLDRILSLAPANARQYSPERFDYGPLSINVASFRAHWNSSEIAVTPEQIRLLRFLAENANRTLSREEIILGLGRNESEVELRTVDVWIRRLREALKVAGGGASLRTVRSLGYVFEI